MNLTYTTCQKARTPPIKSACAPKIADEWLAEHQKKQQQQQQPHTIRTIPHVIKITAAVVRSISCCALSASPMSSQIFSDSSIT